MKRIIHVAAIVVSVALIGWFVKNNLHTFAGGRVEAAGALSFNFGVPNGQPIFSFNNMAPGFTASHTVVANNGDTLSRLVGVKGIKTSGNGDLENAMHIVISQDGKDLYGGVSSTGSKTLTDFFNDSASINGVPLSAINPGKSASYVFTVSFDTGAGNEYQGKTLTFDLQFGIVTEIPSACQGMRLSKIIYGTEGDDVIHGGAGNTLIIGFGGHDKLYGGAGNDCIVGGNDGSTLIGGAGNDVIVGGTGNDIIDGGAGNDRIYGNGGNDHINAGAGDDVIYVGNGKSVIDAGAGNDKVYGSVGDYTIFGGAGNDYLDGGTGVSTIDGGSGKNTCRGTNLKNCQKTF